MVAGILWVLAMVAAIAAIRLAFRAGALRRAMLLCVGAAAVSLAGISFFRLNYHSKTEYYVLPPIPPKITEWSLDSRWFFYAAATLSFTALVIVVTKWLRAPRFPALSSPISPAQPAS